LVRTWQASSAKAELHAAVAAVAGINRMIKNVS
jgi:hypothetical protein